MTVERGVDPRRLALMAFGGAGGLHAAAIAEELGHHEDPLPARVRRARRARPRGLRAPPRRPAQRAPEGRRPRATSPTSWRERAREELGDDDADVRIVAELRYRGQAFELAVELSDHLEEDFHKAHEEAYGYRDPEAEVELVTLRATATTPGPGDRPEGRRRGRRGRRAQPPRHDLRRHGDHPRRAGARRDASKGPRSSSCARRRSPSRPAGAARSWSRARSGSRSGEPRPRHPARRLRRPARRLRGDGRGADPRQPLGEHQGAPRRVLRAVQPRRRARDAGRAHPGPPRRDAGRGGGGRSTRTTSRTSAGSSTTPTPAAPTCPTSPSITPAFADDELIGFAANRAHHADVGGPTPGAMPADSKTLDDEGVVIEPQRLDEDAIERLAEPDAPARAAPRRPARPARGEPHRRQRGCKELHERMPLAEAMEATIDYAERRTRAAIEDLEDGTREATDVLEAADGDLDAVPDGDRRRRRAAPGLHRHRRPARGQPQLPAGGHRLRLLVRRARAHRPRHPAVAAARCGRSRSPRPRAAC